MIRLYEQHVIRKQQELDGMWDFEREDGRYYQLAVPGCWEQHPDMMTYRGKGAYIRKIQLTHETNLRLDFKGVSHTADVYFDGEKIAHHYNAFTSFSGVVQKAAAGEHTIRVEVDNTFSEASALHIPNDYYTYGGITRPVGLEEIADVYIERIHFTPVSTQEGWTAKIEAVLRNIGTESQKITVAGKLESERNGMCGSANAADSNEKCGVQWIIKEQNTEIGAGEACTLVWEQDFPEAQAWNTKTPWLYLLTLHVSVEGIPVDDLVERVGFRTVTMKGQKLCLNGEEIFLKGFNRHEDYGILGCAIPLQLMVQDLDLMQDMGANAVRTCHYPNDERFLDLCDQKGILVWEENHARGLGLPEMQNPHFEQQCEDCIREMIEEHYNHPGIVIWGILNECASETQEGRRMYQKQYEQIKSLDTTRPTTSATCRHFTDICLDLPDVVSFNMYSGWYEDVPVKERHEKEMEWINQEGGAGKPVIVSEFGAAAMYGFRDRGRSKWSEERQADIIRENLEVYREDKRLAGVFIWQFADCRVTEQGGWFATRARSHNNKGIVDEYRRPKEAYDVIKEMFTDM